MDGIPLGKPDLFFPLDEFHLSFQHEDELLPRMVEEHARFLFDDWECNDEGFNDMGGTETCERKIAKTELIPSSDDLFSLVTAGNGLTFLVRALVLKKDAYGHS